MLNVIFFYAGLLNRKLIFLFLNQNICCGHSKELSQWDGSFEHSKHMLKVMRKKIFTIKRIFMPNSFDYINLYVFFQITAFITENSKGRSFQRWPTEKFGICSTGLRNSVYRWNKVIYWKHKQLVTIRFVTMVTVNLRIFLFPYIHVFTYVCDLDITGEIRPDVLSGLIWVQTICKSYQQMTLY